MVDSGGSIFPAVISITINLSDTQQGHHLACPNMPHWLFSSSREFNLTVTCLVTEFFPFCSLVQTNIGIWKVYILTHASYLKEGNHIAMDHACRTSSMQIPLKIIIAMIYLFMQLINHAITISSVQDACLEHAVVPVTSKICKKLSPLHFLFPEI